jgi:hypothetical protein
MPHKYEMFLDKNKKVKLAANDQGEFFMEANGNVVKINDDGMKLGKRADGGIDGLKEIGSSGLSASVTDIGKPVAFETVQRSEEFQYTKDDLVSGWYFAQLRIDSENDITFQSAYNPSIEPDLAISSLKVNVGDIFRWVYPANPGFTSQDLDATFVVTEIITKDIAFAKYALSPTAGNASDFYGSDPFELGLNGAELYYTKFINENSLTFDGVNLFKEGDLLTTDQAAPGMREYANVGEGEVFVSTSNIVVIKLPEVSPGVFGEFENLWDYPEVVNVRITNNTTGDYIELESDTALNDLEYVLGPGFFIQKTESSPALNTEFFNNPTGTVYKVERFEETIAAVPSLSESNSQTTVVFPEGVFNADDNIFVFPESVSFDGISPDGSATSIIKYNVASETSYIDVAGIGKNIKNIDPYGIAIGPNSVTYTFNSTKNEQHPLGSYFTLLAKNGTGDVVFGDNPGIINNIDKGLYGIDLEKAFGREVKLAIVTINYVVTSNSNSGTSYLDAGQYLMHWQGYITNVISSAHSPSSTAAAGARIYPYANYSDSFLYIRVGDIQADNFLDASAVVNIVAH